MDIKGSDHLDQDTDRGDLKREYPECISKALDLLWDVVIIGNRKGDLLWVNDSVKDVLGYETGEFIENHKVGGLTHPDDRSMVDREFTEVVQKPEHLFRIKVRIRHKKGHYVWIDSRAINLSDKEGGHVVFILRDITREREKEKRALIEKANLEAVIENTDDLIALRDREGRLVLFNESWKNNGKHLFGKEMKVGMRTTDLLPPEQRSYWERVIASRVLKGNDHREEFEYTIDGEERFFDLRFKPIFSGNRVIGFTEFTRDVTQSRIRERIIKESDQLHRVIMDNIQDPIIITDSRGLFKFICSNTVNTLKYTADEIRSRGNINSILGEGHLNEEEFEKFGIIKNREVEMEDKEGQVHEFLMDVKKVDIKGGTRLYTFHEITLRKRLERKYDAFIEKSPGIFYTYSPNEGASYWSPRVKDILGFDPKILKKKPFIWHESIHPEDVGYVDEEMEKGIETGGFDIEYRIKDTSGKYHILHDRSIMIHEVEGDIKIEGMATDITDRSRLIEELKKRKQWIEKITSSFPGAMYQFRLTNDGVMNIDFISDNSEKILERSPKYIMENRFPIGDIHPGDREKFIESIETSARDLRNWNHDYRIINPESKKVKWIRGLSTPNRLQDGTTIWNGVIIDITETKSMEEDLERSNKRLTKLVEDIPDGVFVHDPDGNMIMVNREAIKSLGYSREEIMNRRVWEFDPNIIDDDHEHRYWDHLTPDNPQIFETIHERKDGTTFPVEVKLIQNWMKGRKVIIAISRDISERRAMEKRFRSFIDSTPDMVFLKNRSLQNIMVNRSYLDFLGVDPEDVVGRRDQEIFPEDISGKWSESDDRVLEGKKVVKTLQLTKDRRYFDVRKFPVPLMDGEIGIGGVIRDITRRKSAERDLKESERRIKTLISNIPGMVYRCDYSPKWPLIFVSRGSEKLLGMEPEELTGDGGVSYNDFIHPDDREMVWEKIHEAIEEGEQFSIEYRVRDKSGKEKWVLEKGVGIRNKNGKVRFFEGIITDITKSKLAEDKIKEEMNRAEFYLDLLGHDIGNLHQGILTGLELATRFDDQNVKDTGLSSAESLIRKSLLMVKQVQTLSKLKNKEPEPEVVDLNNTFSDYQRRFEVLFPDKTIEIRMELPKHPVRIMAEPVIDALFFNLVHNAIKFHDGKDAMVEIRIEEGDEVEVTIEDHGRGIPDELKEKIFGKFETFGQKGRVGLGLSLVNTLIDRYNGSIEVKDRVEGDHTKGSRFVMSFPTI